MWFTVWVERCHHEVGHFDYALDVNAELHTVRFFQTSHPECLESPTPACADIKTSVDHLRDSRLKRSFESLQDPSLKCWRLLVTVAVPSTALLKDFRCFSTCPRLRIPSSTPW